MTDPKIHAAPTGPPADILVIFGITGDLARKMTFNALYKLVEVGTLDVPIVGVAIDEMDDEGLRERARESITSCLAEEGEDFDEKVFRKLADGLTYVQGDYKDPKTYEAVKKAMGEAKTPVYYLEIPPSLFGLVAKSLAEAKMTDGGRVVIEKPFGHDLDSARALNAELSEVLSENQIFRIDHFLGKEPVMDLLYLRFANTIFEPIWNRRYIDSVRITMAEDFGVEDRGHFYDAVGALRDVVQNHLLQILALIAMEPPTGGSDPDPIRDKKMDLFKAIHPSDPSRYVRGQYDGYLDVDGVAAGSTTETYVALRLEVENWRWGGVPFYLRAGKAMPAKTTEVRVIFNNPPRIGIAGGAVPKADEIIFRIDPNPGACILLEAKEPGQEELRPVHLDLLFDEQFGGEPGPYERLLGDALRGDPEHFAREDMVEASWAIVQPLINDPPDPEVYEQGTWGPESAANLPAGHGGWRKPWGSEPSPSRV
ncbi:MAG: glucose-6-phosphate dehydrogenase [Actinobacteria bacterium]|nr:glucose-6-phosphate dehydrogenase [Actinomycetota bacterium]